MVGTDTGPAAGARPALSEGLKVLSDVFAACHVRRDKAWLSRGSLAAFDPGAHGSCQPCPTLAGLPASSLRHSTHWIPVQAPHDLQDGL